MFKGSDVEASCPMVKPTIDRVNMDILSAFSDDKVSYIAIARNQYAIIDTSYLEMVSQFKWHCSVKGYAIANTWRNGKCENIRMHRMLFLSHHGVDGNDVPTVDHINRDKLDNRLENLRLATNSQNLMNRGATRANTSGYKGVWEKRPGVWIAQIRSEGKHINLGHFSSPEEAALAYNVAAKDLHGVYALLNTVNAIEYTRRKRQNGGVSLDNGRWRARLTEEGKRIHIGFFNSKEDAVVALNKRIGIQSS